MKILNLFSLKGLSFDSFAERRLGRCLSMVLSSTLSSEGTAFPRSLNVNTEACIQVPYRLVLRICEMKLSFHFSSSLWVLGLLECTALLLQQVWVSRILLGMTHLILWHEKIN